jgi:hypothetical protein
MLSRGNIPAFFDRCSIPVSNRRINIKLSTLLLLMRRKTLKVILKATLCLLDDWIPASRPNPHSEPLNESIQRKKLSQ